MGSALVLVVRLLVPLTIFRWPLGGALLSIAADTIDILLFNAFGFPEWTNYQQLDKLLDLYYSSLLFVVVQRWPGFERSVASALFAYRLAGVALFEITGGRALLFVFPNLFEMYYLFVLVVWRWFPTYVLTPARTAMWLAVLLVPKLVQEYLLHWAKVLDNLVAFEVIEDAWRWTTRQFRRPFG